jgi:hypothetical protein
MSLLREFTGVPSGQAPNLKNSDSSDAGKADVSGKLKPNDVSFSLMRNTINSDGDVTGSNVADYLEKAHELNDEVETVPFGLETDDGDIVKVYVNAEEADKFEDAMKKLLGVEDDIEEAINKLAQDFDIIDVVWPKNKDDAGEEGEDVQLGADGDFDALDDGDDEMEEVARYDPLGESVVTEAKAMIARKGFLEIFKKAKIVYVNYAGNSGNTEKQISTLFNDLMGAGSFNKFKANSEFTKTDRSSSGSMNDPAYVWQRELPAWKWEELFPKKVVEDVEPEADDPKAPTPEEAAAYSKLMNIVMNLAAMGPSGVSAATGLDRSNMTKLEMIKEYVKTEYADDADLARTWMKRVGDSVGDSRDILPYWLKEQLESEAHDVEDEGEEDMTIGSQFLARLAEGKEPAKKGYKFDPATESMKRQLRDIGGEKNFADKIAEVAAMTGMQGRFMNTPEGRESVLAGAKGLRTRPAATAAFLSLHSALAAFHGYTPMAEGKDEEADLDGVAFQQLVEEVLVELGIPQSLVSEGGKAGAKSTVKRMISKIMQDSTTKVAYQFLAKKLGIKVNDKIVGTKKAGKPETVEEAVTRGTVGTDGQGREEAQAETTNIKDYTAAAKTILSALGVNLEDTKLVRVVNDGALQRAIRTAMRDGKVKRAASAFLRILSQGE